MSTAAFAGVALGRFYPSVQAPRHQLHVACKERGRGKRAERTSNGVGGEGGGGGGVLMPGACESKDMSYSRSLFSFGPNEVIRSNPGDKFDNKTIGQTKLQQDDATPG